MNARATRAALIAAGKVVHDLEAERIALRGRHRAQRVDQRRQVLGRDDHLRSAAIEAGAVGLDGARAVDVRREGSRVAAVVFRAGEETGANAAEITRAYTVAREIFGSLRMRDEISVAGGSAASLLQLSRGDRVTIVPK